MSSLATAALVVGVVGAGVSVYGQVQQGKAAKAAGDWNSFLGLQEAQQQLMLSGLSQKAAEQEARSRLAVSQAEAEAYYANSGAVLLEARAKAAQARENIRRGRAEGDQVLASQTVEFSGAGFVSTTGTPLDVQAGTMQQIESQAADEAFKANVERENAIYQAKVLRYQGDVVRASGAAELNVAKSANNINGIAAGINFRNGNTQSEMTRRAGVSARNNANLAVGSGLSQVGGAVSAYRK
jgi:hypothetical protein